MEPALRRFVPIAGAALFEGLDANDLGPWSDLPSDGDLRCDRESQNSYKKDQKAPSLAAHL
jgi:hypothetical protein